MDYVLDYADAVFFTPYVYDADGWLSDRSDVRRQFTSLLLVVTLGGFFMYIVPAGLSYCFIYDHDLKKHPLFLKNQIRREMTCALTSVPLMGFASSVVFLLEVRGYSKVYDDFSAHRYGKWGNLLDAVLFIVFTDTLIYWIHRGLHSRLLYRPLHKMHHLWKVPTPFASHAFHPVDGFLQSLPYHVYVFLFPMHKVTYLGMFVFVNLWTVSIHDGDYRVPAILKPFINGSAHHMDHHILFTVNYGQFFTFWDRIGGSFSHPLAFDGKGPHCDVKMTSTTTKTFKAD